MSENLGKRAGAPGQLKNEQEADQRDLSAIEDFDLLASEYKRESNEQPADWLDRQIIAAAHAELEKPNQKKAYQVSWWRRLMLPVYASAIFAVSAIATHWFWPQPVGTLPGNESTTVEFEIAAPESSQEQPKSVRPQLPPEPVLLSPPAKTGSTVAEESAFEESQDETETVVITGSRVKRGAIEEPATSVESIVSVTGDSQPVADKESWARVIREMVMRGEHQAARKELEKFKKAYPDYPIDEQLELLRR